MFKGNSLEKVLLGADMPAGLPWQSGFLGFREDAGLPIPGWGRGAGSLGAWYRVDGIGRPYQVQVTRREGRPAPARRRAVSCRRPALRFTSNVQSPASRS